MRNAAIILRLWKASIMQSMEYRASFVFSIFANFMDFIFGFLQYMIFFTAAQSVAGWTSYEILALYAVFMCIFALQFIFLYPNLVAMGEMVNSGNLDLLLTKPVNAQLILSFRRISLEELGSLATSALLLVWLISNGTILLSWNSVLLFITAMVCSAALVYSLFILLMSAAVKLEKLENMAQLMWSLFSLCRYPVEIYPRWLRHLFYGLFPIAFISTVPASIILGKVSSTIVLNALTFALTAIIISTFIWQKALKTYTSAGG